MQLELVVHEQQLQKANVLLTFSTISYFVLFHFFFVAAAAAGADAAAVHLVRNPCCSILRECV